MTPSEKELAERVGLVVLEEFLDAPTCGRIIAEMRSAPGGPATVYRPGAQSPVDESLRKTTRLMLSEATTESVRRRLLGVKPEVERRFGLALSDCEAPQFLLYRAGDFFVPHQDGNTEQLQYDHLRVRRVSTVVFLSGQSALPAPDTYGGGALAFYEPGADLRGEAPALKLGGEPGLLVAFRADATHGVEAVTRGERFSIVCWYR
jgi:predicted 2-oxoglutarate/Fe(II)-dependent dioxygenase YbiX